MARTKAKSGAKLLSDYQARRERIRSCYERYFLDGLDPTPQSTPASVQSKPGNDAD